MTCAGYSENVEHEVEMAWSERSGGSRYYYRSRREGVQVRRDYFGQGPQAEAAAKEDSERRAHAVSESALWEAEARRDAGIWQVTDELSKWADVLVLAALTDAGLHNHRGQWRRRRYVRNCHG